MKRVEAININGVVFNVDDDAYGKLSAYLNALTGYFKNEQGGAEIIADIEARIAELFAERESGVGQVVSETDVASIIETLGTPEDIAGTDTEPEWKSDRSEAPPKQPVKSAPKRLYRDPDHRFLGGVCAGIAARLGISPVIVRLIFLFVLFFPAFGIFVPGKSFVVLLYFILWAAIPKAKTTAQKLEMRGEPVTIETIEKNIKESISDPSLNRSFRQFLDEVGEILGKVLGVAGRIIVILAGIWLFFVGMVTGIVAGGFFLIPSLDFYHGLRYIKEILHQMLSPLSYNILSVCIVIVVVLFVVACLFWSIKLMTGFKVRNKPVHVVLFIVWLAACITSAAVGFAEARNYAWQNGFSETKQITPAKTLYLTAKTVQTAELMVKNFPHVRYDETNAIFYGKPHLRVHKSETEQPELRMEKESKGRSRSDALRNAENIGYNIEIRDSLLTFPSHFTVEPNDKWKFQTLDAVLYVPEGTVLVIDKELCDNQTLERKICRKLGKNRICVMTENDGLQPLSEKE